VSLLWRDELRLLLTPRQIFLQRRGRGLRPVVAEQRVVDVAGSDGLQWHATVAALAGLLAARPRAHADAVVILSNHFVRYTRVPASDLLVTRDDELQFARHDFVRVFGPAAERWHVSVSRGAEGSAGLASGVPADLVDALRATLQSHALRPRRLVPGLVAAFNATRARLPEGALRLVCVEPGMAVSALVDAQWRRVRSQRMADGEDLERIVQRERALDDAEVANESIAVIPLLDMPAPASLADGTRVQVLPPLWPAVPGRGAESVTEQAA